MYALCPTTVDSRDYYNSKHRLLKNADMYDIDNSNFNTLFSHRYYTSLSMVQYRYKQKDL